MKSPLAPPVPPDSLVVTPSKRSYTSGSESVSEPSGSRDSKMTRRPSLDMAEKNDSNAPLPPAGPVETSEVVLPRRSYRSPRPSVSAATRDSEVRSTTREPSAEAPWNSASAFAFPPAGPVERIVVTPAERS